ncbi:MAG: hypothetical protein PHS40_10330 [Mariniphaga sp.]|nr:hypothetical protein [Mariniphaga sp.]MDD4426311.1 hypothetical protein [Mariniphaga sp.]
MSVRLSPVVSEWNQVISFEQTMKEHPGFLRMYSVVSGGIPVFIIMLIS